MIFIVFVFLVEVGQEGVEAPPAHPPHENFQMAKMVLRPAWAMSDNPSSRAGF